MRLLRSPFAAALWLSAAASPLPSPAATPHFPTSEDLRHTRALRDPQLSPDAAHALITVTEPTVDGAKSHLWLVDIAARTSRQLTFSPKGEGTGESEGRWTPDNSAILFLAKRGETTQIYRLPMAGGEAQPYDLKPPSPPNPLESSPAPSDRPATEDKEDSLPLDVSAFELSPDGRWLAFLAKDPQTRAEKKKKDTDKDDASWVDHDPHGVRLYLVQLDSSGSGSTPAPPAGIAPDVLGIAWAPHSLRLAVITEAPNNLGDLHPARAATLLERTAESWKAVPLPKVPATVQEDVLWSKDEQSLIFLAQAQQDAPPGVSDLYLAAIPGGEPRLLSRDFTGSLRRLVAAEAEAVIAEVAIGTKEVPARFPLLGGKPEPLGSNLPGTATAVDTNLNQTGWLYLQSATATPPTLCFARNLASPCTALSTPVVAPADWQAASAQLVTWKSGSFTIEGLLYLPPAAQHGKVPLIVDVHGGPTGQYTAAYSAFAQFLVGHGWALLQTNPRGSTGYGVAFAAANKNDLGGGDYQDIMAGVDAVLARYPLDANRMALIGYSYGGEMAGFVEGKTTRFRAIVSSAPVIDQMSEYGTESASWYDRWFYGQPWLHPQDAWRQSPISEVAHASTPFLLLQGKADTTDPPGQSEEMYRALRQAGVPVELVEYPRENHGPLAMGMMGFPSREPWHGFDARKRIVDFIQKYFADSQK